VRPRVSRQRFRTGVSRIRAGFLFLQIISAAVAFVSCPEQFSLNRRRSTSTRTRKSVDFGPLFISSRTINRVRVYCPRHSSAVFLRPRIRPRQSANTIFQKRCSPKMVRVTIVSTLARSFPTIFRHTGNAYGRLSVVSPGLSIKSSDNRYERITFFV